MPIPTCEKCRCTTSRHSEGRVESCLAGQGHATPAYPRGGSGLHKAADGLIGLHTWDDVRKECNEFCVVGAAPIPAPGAATRPPRKRMLHAGRVRAAVCPVSPSMSHEWNRIH